MKKQQKNSPNSFYNLGGIEILSISQDETSGLWKIYLSTPEHYLVSREFDRGVGMYANAPDDVVRQGLMDFSESILGNQLSLFKIIDMFIDRCFDESAFNRDTENAIWMCIDIPSYSEVEEALNVYNCRLRWFSKSDDNSGLGENIDRILYKTPTGEAKSVVVDELKQGIESNGISSIFMNDDQIVKKFFDCDDFSDIPIYIGEFSDSGEFNRFVYFKR